MSSFRIESFGQNIVFKDGELEGELYSLFSSDIEFLSLDRKETRELYEAMKKYYEDK